MIRRVFPAAVIAFCCARSVEAISIGSFDMELTIGSSTIPNDSYAWEGLGGQSCNPTGGMSLGGRTYSGYSDPFIYQASSSIALTSPPDQYTIDIRVWTDNVALLPVNVLGSDEFALDKITLYIGGQGWGNRDGLPDQLNPDFEPVDDRFRIVGGAFRSFRSTSTSPGNLLQVFPILEEGVFIDSWWEDQTFDAADVRMILLRLTVKQIPEPSSAVLLLTLLAKPRRRNRPHV